jgi:hypothetical protein
MSDGGGTLAALAGALTKILSPLTSLTPSAAPVLLEELGLPLTSSQISTITPVLTQVTTDVGQLFEQIVAIETAIASQSWPQVIEQTVAAIKQIAQVISDFEQLQTALSGLSIPDVGPILAALPDQLLNYLLAGYLGGSPGVLQMLQLAGVVQRTDHNVTPYNANAPFYTTYQFNFSRLGQLLTSPKDVLADVYDWGQAGFDGTKILAALSDVISQLGLPGYYDSKATPPSFDLLWVKLIPRTDLSPPGIELQLEQGLNGSMTLTRQLWSLTGTLDSPLASGSSLVIRPGSMTLTPAEGTTPSGSISANYSFTPAAPGPLQLIGIPGGSGLSVQQVSALVGLALGAGGDVQFSAGVGLTGGKLLIDMSEADGFLSDVTSGTPIQASFDFQCTWQPSTGLHVTGGAQLEIDLPLHLNLGPVTLPTLYVIGGVANGALTLELSAALGVTLGPIAASVDRVGLLGTLTFPPHNGNLGFANLALGFKPPNGLGLSIDAGVIAGGGYISFDASKGQYAGVISLTLLDIIGITVITVLDTQMPDGSSGFSLLFVITFTLPPIQLGFGFTLVGVGGLGGVNRSMSTSALQAGFAAHSLDAIMFPPNPIANAPQIISDIRSFFPPANGRYLFGPLLQIGWGTPTLISLTIGAILEVPDPVVLALIGLVDCALPDEDTALIALHVEVLGVIDFGAKTLSIDGSLYNSYVLIFSVGGSLAFRLSWGDDPNFVFSMGGFNPNFNTAGLNIPQMARLSVSIGDGDNPRISANSYYAVTSNSVQFGANVQAYASAAGFTIQGYLGYDVLFILSPFSFEFDFQAGFSVSFEGVTLAGLSVDGLFSGPTPWHFHGSASITLLFFTVSASLDLTWGDSTQATIPAKPVLPDLFAALDNAASWSAALPPGASVGVAFVTLKPSDTTLRVHPMGTLTVREHVVPFDVPITRYGNATPSDGTEFSIQSIQINTQTETIQTIQDYFAIGQFETLSDADKLSKPSFEDYDAGVTVGSAAVASGQDRPRTVTYQEYYIDTPTSFSRFTGRYLMPAGIHLALSAQSAGYTSPLKNTGLSKFSAGPQPAAATIDEPPYVIANITDLGVRSDISSAAGTTYYQAQAAVQKYLQANPEETGTLQIMPLYEVAA